MSYYDILLVATLLLTAALISIAVLLWCSFLYDKRNNERQWQLIEDDRMDTLSRTDTYELPAFPKDAHKTRAIPRQMPTRAVERLLRDLGQ